MRSLWLLLLVGVLFDGAYIDCLWRCARHLGLLVLVVLFCALFTFVYWLLVV